MDRTVLDFWANTATAVARHDIPDSPLAEVDAGAQAGQRGDVVDVDYLDGYVYVDFGRGAIPCYPEELR